MKYEIAPEFAKLPLVHRRIQRIQVSDDLAGGLGPGEGLGVIVVLGDVTVDRGLEVGDRVEAAAFEPAPGERREEGLDGVEPGARGRREVEVLAQARPAQPLLAKA
jgi:hypothetical protein